MTVAILKQEKPAESNSVKNSHFQIKADTKNNRVFRKKKGGGMNSELNL
jgi:hypothetical protein